MFLSDDTDKGNSEEKTRVDQRESNLWPFFSLKWFISLSLSRIFLHQNIHEAGLVEIVFISFPSRPNYGEIICPSKA